MSLVLNSFGGESNNEFHPWHQIRHPSSIEDEMAMEVLISQL